MIGVQETLFDLDGGAPQGVAAVEVDLRDPDVWQQGLDYPLSQADRAMIVVAPNEVNIAERAGHLTMALTEIAKRNRDRGFVQASASTVHRPAIEARYGVHTDGMAEGVDYRALTGERRAQYEFFAASGLGRLALASNTTPLTPAERVARRVMIGSWQAFLGEYGGTGAAVRRKRDGYKAKLARQLDTQEDIA